MNFLTSAILANILWNKIKDGRFTENEIRISLKNWILEDRDYEKIVNKINVSLDV
jgi:hypothetical protein